MPKTKEEIADFLWDLQWSRVTKDLLQKRLNHFFGVEVSIEENTDNEDFDEVDYSFNVTTAQKECATSNYVDIEIDYLFMRKKGWFLITGSSILDYNY